MYPFDANESVLKMHMYMYMYSYVFYMKLVRSDVYVCTRIYVLDVCESMF